MTTAIPASPVTTFLPERDNVYSQAELAVFIAKMERVSLDFYQGAIQTGCHPFIEFCGVMSKYIDLCRAAMKQGIDFTQANTHTGLALPIETHDMGYLAEKLDCIFGPSLRARPEILAHFIKTLQGNDDD